MSVTPPRTDSRRVKWLGLPAVGLTAVGLLLIGGTSGIAATIALGVAWYALSTPYTVALGHLLLAALLPESGGLPGLLAAEGGLLGMLAINAPGRDDHLQFGAAFVTSMLLLSCVAVLGVRLWGLPAAALLLAAVALLVGYGLHRYELLRLGLLEEPTDATTDQ